MCDQLPLGDMPEILINTVFSGSLKKRKKENEMSSIMCEILMLID